MPSTQPCCAQTRSTAQIRAEEAAIFQTVVISTQFDFAVRIEARLRVVELLQKWKPMSVMLLLQAICIETQETC